jgi:hypothetical protein
VTRNQQFERFELVFSHLERRRGNGDVEHVAPALNSVVVPGGVHFIDRGVVKLLVICPS